MPANQKTLAERQEEMRTRPKKLLPRRIKCPGCQDLIRVYVGGLEQHFLKNGMTCKWSGRKW